MFSGPSTAVVALGFASDNNGDLESTKHTVSLPLHALVFSNNSN
jgi:hypothetical protein